MNTKLLILIVIVSNLCLGCSFISKPKMEKAPKPLYVNSGEIVNGSRLSSGGKIIIVPFTAGSQIAATDELDHLSLKVIKGISDVISTNKSYSLIGSENAHEADFMLSGHVTEMVEPGKFKKWVMMKRKKIFAVKGKIIEIQTGDVLLYFRHSASNIKKTETFETLADRVGREIGQFILTVK